MKNNIYFLVIFLSFFFLFGITGSSFSEAEIEKKESSNSTLPVESTNSSSSNEPESESANTGLERGGSHRLSVMDLYGHSRSSFIANETIYFIYGVHTKNPSGDTVETEIIVNLQVDQGDEKQILYEKLVKKFGIDESRVINWNFIPEKEGEYLITFIANELPPESYGFRVIPQTLQTMSPLKQIDGGILPENVVCQDGRKLIFKSTDGSPACVFNSTVKKLIERDWTSE